MRGGVCTEYRKDDLRNRADEMKIKNNNIGDRLAIHALVRCYRDETRVTGIIFAH